MNRVMVILASALALAGCTSGGGMSVEWLPRFEPKPVDVLFQSQPPGAEAKTSTGQTCQTPCSLAMPPDKDFTVTFALAGHQPQTIAVQPTRSEETFDTSLQPNPVEVALVVAPRGPQRRTTNPPRRTSSTIPPAARPVAVRPAAPRPAAAAPPPQAAPPPADPWPQVR